MNFFYYPFEIIQLSIENGDITKLIEEHMNSDENQDTVSIKIDYKIYNDAAIILKDTLFAEEL